MSRKTARPRFLALALAAACAVFAMCALVPAGRAYAAIEYGQLCAMFETGTDPYECDLSDPYGGNVFGAFQISSGHAVAYAKELQASSNKTYASYGDVLMKGYKKDGNICAKYFGAAWRSIFAGKKDEYLESQYKYVKREYYDLAVKEWQSKVPGFKASRYSTAFQNVLFSTCAQHGVYGSANVFKLAMDNLGGYSKDYSEDKVMAAIYAERARFEPYSTFKKTKSSTVYKITSSDGGSLAKKYGLIGMTLIHFYSNPGSVQTGVYNRLVKNEPAEAFKLYTKYTGKTSHYNSASIQAMAADPTLDASTCKHAATSGGNVVKYYSITDKSHKEKVAKVVCSTCGEVLQKSYKRTVKNVYVQKGKAYKDVCGRSYTVHAKGWYRALYSVSVRKKKSTTSKALAKLAKKKNVKVAKAYLGSDGFWWGKVKVGGKKGYIKMQNLTPIGDALGVHSYTKAKVCKYCGKSKAAIKRMNKVVKAYKRGTRTFSVAAAGVKYKNAYANASATAGSLGAGATVTVKKIVKNRYNDYWAKLAGGGYVDLTLLK